MLARDQQAFGNAPAFPAPLKHNANKHVRFGDTTIRTPKEPNWRDYGNALLTGKWRRLTRNQNPYWNYVDREVPTNFKKPVSRFTNRPGATSSPAQNENTNSPGLQESPIPQRYSAIRPGYRHNESSFYEDAMGSPDSTQQFFTPEGSRSTGIIDPAGMSFNFGQLNLGNDTTESVPISSPAGRTPVTPVDLDADRTSFMDWKDNSTNLPVPEELAQDGLNRGTEMVEIPNQSNSGNITNSFNDSANLSRDPLQMSDSNNASELTRDPLQISNMPEQPLHSLIERGEPEQSLEDYDWDYSYTDISNNDRPSHESKANTSRAKQRFLRKEETLDEDLNQAAGRARPSRQRREPERFRFEKLGGSNKKPNRKI